jgi:hypothetical protein
MNTPPADKYSESTKPSLWNVNWRSGSTKIVAEDCREHQRGEAGTHTKKRQDHSGGREQEHKRRKAQYAV